MYTKAERLRSFLTPDYAERLAGVLYGIGRGLSAQSDFQTSIKGLERANDIINSQNLEGLSREGTELRLAILQAQIAALLGTDKSDNL